MAEVVHPRGLDFTNQRRVVTLKDVHGFSFRAITRKVKNLKGGRPSFDLVRQTYRKFAGRVSRRRYNYKKCGRRCYKVTTDVKKFLIQRMLKMRQSNVCTSTALQREVAAEKGVSIAASTIRKVLKQAGYRWLPRAQTRRFSHEDLAARRAFTQQVVDMSPAAFRRQFGLSMDGCVLGVPQADPVQRANFCTLGDTHMWRKPSEAASPALAGHDPFGKQVPLTRAVPLWGCISLGGVRPLLFHKQKKLTAEEWAAAVERGVVRRAIQTMLPDKRGGPCRVICDNESFLRAPASVAAHRKAKLILWKIPPRSPDLNPIERFWGWLRRALRQKDLADLAAKRPALTKAAYVERVRALCKTRRAQRVARNICLSLPKVCREVLAKNGAMTR